VKNYLQSIKEIQSAKISLVPFWVTKVPSTLEKIILKISND